MYEFNIKRSKMEPSIASYQFLDINGNLIQEDIDIIPTVRGTYFISKNDKNRVGKIENISGQDKFFIKTIKFGSPGEILADPVNNSIYPAYGNTDNRSRTYEYTQVSEETFQIYTKYLYTKNSSYFQNVVRRLKNGEA